MEIYGYVIGGDFYKANSPSLSEEIKQKSEPVVRMRDVVPPIDNIDWKEKYETAIKQKINYSKEVDRLREKYEPKAIANEYRGA